jgi:hypothetical protein
LRCRTFGALVFDLNQFKPFARDYRHGGLHDEANQGRRPLPLKM